MKLEDLPAYLYRDDSDLKHFLTVNRTATGKWTAAYTEFEQYLSIFPISNADTLQEVAIRMHAYLKRNHKL